MGGGGLRAGGLGALALLLICICGTYGKFYTHTPADVRFTTFSCGGNVRWCGEKWRADRILTYNYTVWSEVVVQKNSVTEIVSDCSHSNGGPSLNSTDCRMAQSSAPSTLPRVIVRRFNRTRVHIEKWPPSPSGLEIIKTDNLDTDGNLKAETFAPNQDKIWQIKIPRNCRMVIYFPEFDIKSSPNCMQDNFTVQTNKNQTDIRKYCDTLHHIVINYRRRVQLWFHSGLFDPELDDPLPPKRGVYATTCFASRSIDAPPCSCNSEHTQKRRSIKAPVRRSYSERRQYQKAMEEKDTQVGAWLAAMMQGGKPVVEEFLKNSSNADQQYLARKYQATLEYYSRDENS